MAAPTLDQITDAIYTWSDTYVVGALGANTPAFKQVHDQLDPLAANLAAQLDNNAEAFATSTLTLTPGAIADDKVEIGGVYYQFASSVSGDADGSSTSPWKVKVGGSDAISLANLRKAINATGVAGTDYSTGLIAHPTVTATASDATTLSAQAIIPDAAGNDITTSVTVVTTDDGLAWTGATLSGGSGDNGAIMEGLVRDMQETLLAPPIANDSAASDVLNAAIPSLLTTLAALIAA